MEPKFELIICIVNSGYSNLVVDAARSAGAGGGTIMNARGSANPQAEKLFNISVDPEKDLVMIVVKKTIADKVLTAVYDHAGLASDAAGIAFSMPIDNIVGLPKKQYENIE